MKKHTLFNNSKYTRWYYAIIEKRAITDRRQRGEVHHIIPKSLGGEDASENLVKLSGHDHAWCHWLLTKMTTGKDQTRMVYAFNMMSVYGDHMERQSSYAIVRAYERNRIEWSKTHSETMRKQFENGREAWNKGKKLEGEKYKKAGRSNEGRTLAPEVAEAKRLRQIGRTMSAESSQKKRDAMIGFVRGPMSDGHRKSISDGTKGKAKSAGHGDKVAAANRGVVSINLDGIEKKVKKDAVQDWLDKGWSLGGKKRLIKA